MSTKDRETKKVAAYTGLAVADLRLPVGGLTAKDGVVPLSAVPATGVVYRGPSPPDSP